MAPTNCLSNFSTLQLDTRSRKVEETRHTLTQQSNTERLSKGRTSDYALIKYKTIKKYVNILGSLFTHRLYVLLVFAISENVLSC